MFERNILIGAQVFGKGKIYKPTWTQNHPLAFGRRMVLCPALEKWFRQHFSHWIGYFISVLTYKERKGLGSEMSLFLGHCTEVRFASFLSGEITTTAVINPPDRKLAKHTSVQKLPFCKLRPYLSKSLKSTAVIIFNHKLIIYVFIVKSQALTHVTN